MRPVDLVATGPGEERAQLTVSGSVAHNDVVAAALEERAVELAVAARDTSSKISPSFSVIA